MVWIDKHKLWLFAGIVSILAALLRLNGLSMESVDYQGCLGPWYYTIRDNGGLKGISQQVGDYNVLYQLLIALMTYLPFYPLYMYKALSVFFDYLMAASAGLIVFELSDRSMFRAVLAYAAVLLLPTVFINSAWWAQCDSIYTMFVLLALYFILKQRETLAFVMIGIAFQFKLQTVFVIPFLLYYYAASRRFSLLNFLLIPLMSMVVCVLCGRSPLATFQIYAGQAGNYVGMSHNFPNIWNLISRHDYLFKMAAIMLTICILGIGLLITMQRKVVFDRENIYKWLVWTIWTCLIFLPSLHERYAYMLGILLVMALVLNAKMLGYVVLFEITILIGYVRFLWGTTGPAQISDYVFSVMFLLGYVIFTYQNLVLDDHWLEKKTVQ